MFLTLYLFLYFYLYLVRIKNLEMAATWTEKILMICVIELQILHSFWNPCRESHFLCKNCIFTCKLLHLTMREITSIEPRSTNTSSSNSPPREGGSEVLKLDWPVEERRVCFSFTLFLACVQTITKLWLVNQSLISSARRLRFVLWSVKTSSLAKYDYVDYCENFMLLVGKKKLWKQRGIWVWIRAFDHTRARSWM